MTAAAFAQIPDRTPAGPRGLRKALRRLVVYVGLLIAIATTTLTFATPAQAWPWDDIASDITNFCTPLKAPIPESPGSGLDTLMDSRVSDPSISTATVIAPDGKNGWPKPSYTRYGMAGLKWDVAGTEVGCFDMSRYFNELPNDIFSVSKFFAGLSMALIHWAFNDPFSFLDTPIGSVAKAVSAVAAQFLGIVGIAGALYLFFKHGRPGAQVGAFFKGVVWMGMIAGLFFWVQANPSKLGDDINGWAGEFAATGFQAMSQVNAGNGFENCAKLNTDQDPITQKNKPADSTQNQAIECIQDAFWQPLVYQPWLVGEVGSVNGPEADKFGPEALNANYVGADANGTPDGPGQTELSDINDWNHDAKTGHDSMSGFDGVKFAPKIPFVRMWAIDICHLDTYHGDEGLDRCKAMSPADAHAAAVMGGASQLTRFDAAGMSVLGGLVINASIYFLTAMLLAAKLGVYVLMVFAPLYLMLGIFPGPARVAAIKLGDMLLANLIRQVSWELAFVIVAYMDTVILKPGVGVGWILQLMTCVLFTVLLALYARPAVKAITGMARGDMEAGGAIEGVGASAAKTAAFAAVAAASGGTSAAAAGLGKMGIMKAAAGGALRTMPAIAGDEARWMGLRGAVLQGRETADKEVGKENSEEEKSLKTSREWREEGNDYGADRLEAAVYEKHRKRTGEMHQDDPRRRENAHGYITPNGRLNATGQEVLAELGLNDRRVAAAQHLDQVAAAYKTADAIAPGQGASDALRRYVMASETGLVPDAIRIDAANAIVANGLPDRIDQVAAVSTAPIYPRLVASALRTEYAGFAQISGDLSVDDRMQRLNGIENIARNVPTGTPMAGDLHSLRQVLANPKTTPAQVSAAYVNAAVSVQESVSGRAPFIGPLPQGQSRADAARQQAQRQAEDWLKGQGR